MDGKSLDVMPEKLVHLKALFPDIFAEDKIDLQRLKEILGEEVFVQNEHYELSWAGKSEARREIQKQTTATLTLDRIGSVNFGSTQNVFIEGENLEVLRVLQKSYFGKIKIIYIDPPYNTGNDSFVYPDDYSERSDEFNKRTGITDENGFLNKQDLWQRNNRENGRFHSVWLSMMYPRLYLARNLLREDGVIFISIDDNEASNLKLICDEIFGEENFISSFIWKRRQNVDSRSKNGASVDHEYIIVYSKNADGKIRGADKDMDKYSNPDNDPRGVWMSDNMIGLATKDQRPNLHYDVIDPETGINYGCPVTGWRYEPKRMTEFIKNGEVIFPKLPTGRPRRKKFQADLISEFTGKSSILNTAFNTQATRELRELFGGADYFDFPRPIDLVKEFISQLDNNEIDTIILDFFAGSGTTAQAVMELNEENGGNRQFICVQMPEALGENSEAYKSGYKTIADITKARISKVIEKITTERESKLELETRQPLGFNAYKLAPSNFKIWRSDIQGKDAILEQLQVFQSSEKSGSPQENMLTELLLKTGLGLGVKYIQEQNFYKVGNLWICFEKFQPEMKEQILQGGIQKVIFLNSCFASDAKLSNLQLELKENEINLVII